MDGCNPASIGGEAQDLFPPIHCLSREISSRVASGRRSVSSISLRPRRAITAARMAHTAPTTRKASQVSTTSARRSEEHTSELQSRENLVCRLLLEKKKQKKNK